MEINQDETVESKLINVSCRLKCLGELMFNSTEILSEDVTIGIAMILGDIGEYVLNLSNLAVEDEHKPSMSIKAQA